MALSSISAFDSCVRLADNDASSTKHPGVDGVATRTEQRERDGDRNQNSRALPCCSTSADQYVHPGHDTT